MNDEKRKAKTPRQSMPEQNPIERGKNFLEVALGYSEEQATIEASRCIKCKKPLCIEGCPVSVPIPDFISLITKGEYEKAAMKIMEKNALPAVCGRVCPQEKQCEAKCILGKKDKPVAIGRLERFVADWFMNNSTQTDSGKNSAKIPPTGFKVAVIGAGPSGLTVAGDMILKGHEVTIFEALHKPGGVLIYGIPEFRLPKKIVEKEIENLKDLGVKVMLNAIIGRLITIDELEEEYDAIYLGLGAGLPNFLGIEGENLIGVFSSNEYLTRTNLMKAYKFPEYDTPVIKARDVAVFGAGNVAMDAARTALRIGAENVSIIYRRSRDEMPARQEEIHHAEEEGIQLRLLTNPIKFTGDDKGRLTAVECMKMELGEPDESGRRRPVPVKDSNFTVPCDMAVIAIGSGANPLLTSSTSGLELNKRGYIKTDIRTGKTTRQKIWAGGDIVTGSATVIEAMGAGRIAANSIHEYLLTEKQFRW